jgi:hypothetical protein
MTEGFFVEVPIWTDEILRFSWGYHEEDDMISVTPVTEDGDQDYSSIFFQASHMETLLLCVLRCHKDMQDQRRLFRRANKHGVSSDVVRQRLDGIYIAEKTSRELQDMVRESL